MKVIKEEFIKQCVASIVYLYDTSYTHILYSSKMLINSYFVLLLYFVGYCQLRFPLHQVAENVNLYILLYGIQFIHIQILVNCYLKSWKKY